MNRMRHRQGLWVAALIVAGALVCTPARAANCANDSSGMVPLTDLGSGLYHGYQGGLYAGGANARPSAHDAAGIAIANAMTPIDTLGQPDPNGRIVLISIGMSNATQEFSAFVARANTDPSRNPRVQVIDCAIGGQSADRINTPAAAYWDSVRARLRGRGSSPAQVQVAWIKQANAGPNGGFPAATLVLQNNLGAIVRILADQLPNVKLAYLTSRIYAGYASTSLNPEPYSYESAFAVKWLIDAQIAGEDSLNWNPDAGSVESPWLSWGPYLWADGLEPRSDGLMWACAEFAADGTHPGNLARAKVADSLLAFFHRDPTTEPWFVNHVTAAVPATRGEALAFSIAPNPVRDELAVTFAMRAGVPWRIEIVDLAGRRIEVMGRGIGSGTTQSLRWSASGATRAGIYWVCFVEGDRTSAKRVALIAP